MTMNIRITFYFHTMRRCWMLKRCILISHAYYLKDPTKIFSKAVDPFSWKTRLNAINDLM